MRTCLYILSIFMLWEHFLYDFFPLTIHLLLPRNISPLKSNLAHFPPRHWDRQCFDLPHPLSIPFALLFRVANLLFFRPTDTQRNCLLPLFDSPSQVTTYPHASTRNIVSDEELCVWHIDRPFKRITGLMLSFTFSPIRIEGFIFRNNSHSWDSKNYKAASVHRGKAQANNERNETTKGRKKPPEWGNISWN